MLDPSVPQGARTLTLRQLAILDRLLRRSAADASGCWVWLGAVSDRGHGRITVDGLRWRVHRLAWLLLVAELPPEGEILQRCGNRRCWRPDPLGSGPDSSQGAMTRAQAAVRCAAALWRDER